MRSTRCAPSGSSRSRGRARRWRCGGASDRMLGALATVMRRWDQAERHLGNALVLNRRLAAPTWIAHTLYERARLACRRRPPAALRDGPRASVRGAGRSAEDRAARTRRAYRAAHREPARAGPRRPPPAARDYRPIRSSKSIGSRPPCSPERQATRARVSPPHATRRCCTTRTAAQRRGTARHPSAPASSRLSSRSMSTWTSQPTALPPPGSSICQLNPNSRRSKLVRSCRPAISPKLLGRGGT